MSDPLTAQSLLYLTYVLAAAAAILLVEALFATYLQRNRRKIVNRRLGELGEERANERKFRQLLIERGLTGGGDYSISQINLNRLYVQSGTVGSMGWFLLRFAFAAVVLFVAGALYGLSLPVLISGLVAVAVLLPLLVLRRRRKKRIAAFEKQLPDAIDMIVRSLRAGHPTMIAIALVGREMPDPVGSEFGLATDEVTFGSDLDTALRNMYERVGFEGLGLLVMSVSIQARTGGNLADVLTSLSRTLRERAKLRLKIRALSAEGRASAYIMSAFPVFMFLVLTLIAPKYYGEIWGDPIVMPVLIGFGLWALVGNAIMYRMVNFDF